MRLLALLLVCAVGAAVEIETTVERIADGDTLSVTAVDGLPPGAKRGKAGDVYVRLLCIDTQEIWDESRPKTAEGFAARDLLAELAKPGSTVVLWDEGDQLTTDRYGRVLAFVRAGKGRKTLQEALIAAGLTAYWRRWRIAPEPLHGRLLAAEEAARSGTLGAWRTQSELMAKKSAERPK